MDLQSEEQGSYTDPDFFDHLDMEHFNTYGQPPYLSRYDLKMLRAEAKQRQPGHSSSYTVENENRYELLLGLSLSYLQIGCPKVYIHPVWEEERTDVCVLRAEFYTDGDAAVETRRRASLCKALGLPDCVWEVNEEAIAEAWEADVERFKQTADFLIRTQVESQRDWARAVDGTYLPEPEWDAYGAYLPEFEWDVTLPPQLQTLNRKRLEILAANGILKECGARKIMVLDCCVVADQPLPTLPVWVWKVFLALANRSRSELRKITTGHRTLNVYTDRPFVEDGEWLSPIHFERVPRSRVRFPTSYTVQYQWSDLRRVYETVG